MTIRYIALVGYPKSGKSTVQDIFKDIYGVMPVDDGACLRDFAMRHLGLSHHDVHTQEGKKRVSDVLGKPWEHRDILGTFGKHLEQMFGEHIMPWIATRNLSQSGQYSFGSVRKTQGRFFKKHFGQESLVIEVTRPGAGPTGYDFDEYDRHCIDMQINNAGSIQDLEKVIRFVFDGKLLAGESFDVV